MLKRNLFNIILIFILLILSILSLFIGVLDINIGSLLKDEQMLRIFLNSRLPRLLTILCTGIGLSIAGLIMQKITANKFVSPATGSTISGAQLGILLAIVLIPSSGVVLRSLFAFIIALAVTLVFILFITKMKLKDPILVPLIGIMISNLISGLTSYIAYKTDSTQTITAYFTGTFSGIVAGKYEIVWLVVPLLIIAFIFSNHFNIAGLGKDFSKNLGVNYTFILVLGLSISAMITASIVVVVGTISYRVDHT